MFDRGADCEPQVDRTERVKDSVPQVQFATVFFSRKERDEIRRLVEARGWTQPVAVDADGAVANLYGVGGCPTTIFARAGGTGRRRRARQPHRGRAAGQGGADLAMTTELELELREGWVEAELAAEFPELRLVHAALDARPGRSPRELKERLRGLADRYTGAKVVHMRQDSVPWAYRVFSRQVGIDPDSDRTPVEAIALERLRHGGLRSQNLLDDALTVAIAETGVPLVALDAERVGASSGCASRGRARRSASCARSRARRS